LPLALSLAEARAFAGETRAAREILSGLDVAWLDRDGQAGRLAGGLAHWAATVCLRAQDWDRAWAVSRAHMPTEAALGHADLNLLWNRAALSGGRDAFLEVVQAQAVASALGPGLEHFWRAEALALAGAFAEALEPLAGTERAGLVLLGRVPLLKGTALACSGRAEDGAERLLQAQERHFTNNLRVAWGWAAGLEAALALLHLGRGGRARQALAQAVRAYPGPGNPCRMLLRYLEPGPLPRGFARRCLAEAEACPSAMNAGYLGRAWLLLLAALAHGGELSGPGPSRVLALLRSCPGLRFPGATSVPDPASPEPPGPETLARAFYPRDPSGSARLAALTALAAGERF